jgi:hypothetical protein
MAGLAGTVLKEVAVQAVKKMAPAAGASIVAGTANEIRKKQEEADKAKDTPLARTAAQAKADECAKAKKCDECPPDRGVFRPQNTAGWSETSIMYQARICRLPVTPGFITEWLYNGVSFDGFDSSECMLKEAKARYDQFFDMWGGVLDWWEKGADKTIEEAMRQGVAATPRPPTRLRWHFMEPVSYRYFSGIIQAAYPDVEVVFQP